MVEHIKLYVLEFAEELSLRLAGAQSVYRKFFFPNNFF
jgi:hypothetical protein